MRVINTAKYVAFALIAAAPGRSDAHRPERAAPVHRSGPPHIVSVQPSRDATAGRVLLASVVDARNRPLVTVEADDFVITEGAQPRDVLDVHVADYPVVILIDDGPDTGSDTGLPAMKSAVGRFVARIGQRPVAIGTLSLADGFVADFEDERGEVLSRLEQVESASAPPAALEAIAHAAQRVIEVGAPFSAVVIVTSRPPATADPASASRLPGVLESGAAIHVITGSAPDADPTTPDLLRGLAEQTHGQYTRIFANASYAIALERLADRMATEMMVDYLVPPGPAAGDVRVGIRVPGARVVGLGVSR